MFWKEACPGAALLLPILPLPPCPPPCWPVSPLHCPLPLIGLELFLLLVVYCLCPLCQYHLGSFLADRCGLAGTISCPPPVRPLPSWKWAPPTCLRLGLSSHSLSVAIPGGSRNMYASGARSHLSLLASLPMTGWMFYTERLGRGLVVELLVDQYHSPVPLSSPLSSSYDCF